MSFRTIGTGLGILGIHPYCSPSPFPLRLQYVSVLPLISNHLLLHFISVSSFRPTYLHLFGRPFIHSLQISFQSWDWFWYPTLWSQRRIYKYIYIYIYIYIYNESTG